MHPKSETDRDQSELIEAARGFMLRRSVSKQGSERLRSRTEIQVEEEEPQN